MRLLAISVTRIFNPFSTALATVFVAVFVQQIPLQPKTFWFVLFVLVALAPVAVFYGDYRRGKFTSFWSPEGGERVKAFWAWIVVAFAYTVLAHWLAASKLLTALALVFLILGIVNLILAPYFKLSVHLELVTLLVLVCILTVSVNLIYLVFLIPLVGWARIYLKAHCLSEVSFGVLAAILVVYFVFAFLG